MDVTHAQRALWMVLITSIAAPFFASLIFVALSLLSPIFDAILPVRAADEPLGAAAVSAFAWSALPALAAAIILLPFVLQTGTYGWLAAATAGVFGFAAGFFVFPFAASTSPAYLAFIGGLIALGMREMLIRGRILLP
jgi:hypothetical protein